MQNIHLNYAGNDLTFNQASHMAINAAKENQLREPAIISWHQSEGGLMSPDSAWEKYGENHGGRLEIHVGDRFDFIVSETAGYETLESIPLRNLRAEDGTEYICYASHDKNAKLDGQACMPLDDWAAKQN